MEDEEFDRAMSAHVEEVERSDATTKTNCFKPSNSINRHANTTIYAIIQPMWLCANKPKANWTGLLTMNVFNWKPIWLCANKPKANWTGLLIGYSPLVTRNDIHYMPRVNFIWD